MAEAKKKESRVKSQELSEDKKQKLEAKPRKSNPEGVEVDKKPETEDQPQVVKATTKAGKRSEKGLKAAEEKQTKLEKQAHADEAKPEAEKKPKQVQKVRSKLERRGKKFRKAAELIEKGKAYGLKEAMDLATQTSSVKFDATVELHVRLGVDPKQADQNIRDIVLLPAGTGKTARIAVFAEPDGVTAAKKAEADIAAGDEFLQQLEKGVLDFDILIATPAQMPKLGKYARILGPKGLMPNPKSGTVTNDVSKAVTEAKAGRVEYRVDSTGIVHVSAGKVSFGADKLLQNAEAILQSIKQNKPASLKGNYIKTIYATTSMGPSILVTMSAA